METLFEQFPKEIAAVIVSRSQRTWVCTAEGGISGRGCSLLRNMSAAHFDEVITGFRLGLRVHRAISMSMRIVTYGKIIGAGMPVGAYGGRRDVMSMVSPVGPVYQAGTLSGNPVAMQAGMTQAENFKEHPEIYTELNAKGDWFYEGLDEIAKASGTGW